jgi:hypothetical protein
MRSDYEKIGGSPLRRSKREVLKSMKAYNRDSISSVEDIGGFEANRLNT